MRPILPVLVLLASVSWCAGETFEEKLKATDVSDAEQVFNLATWCREHQLNSRANEYFNKVIKLDKDHEGARAALGQIRVGERWVSKSLVEKSGVKQPVAPGNGGGAGAPRSGGPGPKLADVAWDLKTPVDPTPGSNPFLEGYLDLMRKSGNDTDDMGRAIATLHREDNWPSAYARICAGLADGSFQDLFGPADIVLQLIKAGRHAEARQLFQFMGKASVKITDQQELQAFCFAAQQLRERRAVPQLIECLKQPGIVGDAQAAIAAITLLPEKAITPEKVQQWWDRNHSSSEESILLEQVRSDDPMVVVEACKGLYVLNNKAFVPPLLRVLKGEDKMANKRGQQLLVEAFGRDWSYDPMGPADQRASRVVLIEKWWKEESLRFQFKAPVEDKSAVAAAKKQAQDPSSLLVPQLTSAAGDESVRAEQQLRQLGPKAVPALIEALGSPASLLRRKANDLLKEITRQDQGFDPRADEPLRQAAIAKWRAWAEKEGLLQPAGEADHEPPK